MLAKSLLTVEFKGDNIKPQYVHNGELAEKIISIFKENKGKKFKALKREIIKLERGRMDYKVIRALAELIQRCCEFTPSTNLDILEIRRALFERGFVIDEEERDLIIETIARKFGVLKEDIEKAMFADLLKEQELKQIDSPSPEELVRKYNLSLTQTLLFHSIEIVFTAGGNYQQIFRTINYLGLMYETDGTEIRVIGPVSLLKNTKKYGSSFAKLVPYVIKSKDWSIEAKIQMERNNEPRIFSFKLNSRDDIPLPISNEKEIEFDSEVEEQFYNDISLYASDWKIKREPIFIKAGNSVIIPDFGFYKNGITLYLEIVGFWTPEYIQKKIDKFNQVDTKIIAVVNERLKCSKEDFPGDVIFYKKRIPIKPVLDVLKREEKKNIKKEIANNKTIIIREEIVDLKTKAVELNISPQALEQIELPSNFIIGKKIVSKDFLDNLKKEIGEKRKFLEIKTILEKYQLTDKALELIGYKVIWKGLIPTKITEN